MPNSRSLLVLYGVMTSCWGSPLPNPSMMMFLRGIRVWVKVVEDLRCIH